MLEMVCIKELREEAWGLQNRLSGRAGISGNALNIPEDVKNGIYKLTSEQLQLCADSERSYISPEDFEFKAVKISSKLKQLSAHLETLPVTPALPVKPKRIAEAAEVYQEETDLATGGLVEEALRLIELQTELLDLSGLKITDLDLEILIDKLRETSQGTVKKLVLADNDISDSGAQRLAGFLATGCPGLVSLDVSGNPLGPAGLAALTQGLSVIRKQLVLIT